MNRIELIRGDITTLQVDAIVNAANSALAGGGGVDGAIHRVGGPAIMEECRKIRDERGGCQTGNAVITTAGRLKAKLVIHAVGPVWHGGDRHEKDLLRNAYFNSLVLARDHQVKTIAFPNISTGVYGFPKKDAAQIAVATVRNFFLQEAIPEKAIFCCFDQENYLIYQRLLS